MKIRSGFVSNSSSASYMIDDSAYQDVFTLALAMLRIRNEDSEDNNDWNGESAKIVSAYSYGIDPNRPVMFPTCNYDTYIMRKNGYYIIETCNNHDFGSYLSSQTWNSDVLEQLNIEGDSDGISISHMDYFWDIANDVVGKAVLHSEVKYIYCIKKNHWIHKVHLWGSNQIVCPNCWRKSHSGMLLVPKKGPKEKKILTFR